MLYMSVMMVKIGEKFMSMILMDIICQQETLSSWGGKLYFIMIGLHKKINATIAILKIRASFFNIAGLALQS